MEKRNIEHHCAITFGVKLKENGKETCEKLKRAYGEHAVSRTQVFRWHKTFLVGRECGRRTSFWRTLHVKNGRKYDHSQGSREV
jgi:hypothetical protein